MKPRLSLNECESLIQLLKSEDKENIVLGAQILLSGSYKITPQLRTAVYRAKLMIRGRKHLELNKYGEYNYSDRGMCILALKRYKQKLIRYEN